MYDLLENYGLTSKILCWSDNNPLKFGKPYKRENLKIVAPGDLIRLHGTEPTIIVASSAYDVIRGQLASCGYPEDRIVLYNFAFMDLDYTDKAFIYDHIEDFERAYGRLADEKSKRICEGILNYRITKDARYLDEMAADIDDEHRQYFPQDLFKFSSEECFLDVGAYTGDTYSVFNEVYHGEWSHYYGMEADDSLYEELAKTTSQEGQDRVTLLKVAAWDSKTKLSFESNPGSSKMEKQEATNGKIVDANRIDDLLPDARITFAKMDIEGAEYNALLGMAKTIKRNKPVLAICVYHKRDDFYKLTDLVESYVTGEYTYYMRQYRYTPTETVCYMVPKGRIIGGI